jgi:hypothetical protein
VGAEIRWTEESEEHIARHRVAPGEVEEAIYGRPRLVAPGRQGTRVVFGTTATGRYLAVVVAESLDGLDYVVTARQMTDSERRSSRKRAR